MHIHACCKEKLAATYLLGCFSCFSCWTVVILYNRWNKFTQLNGDISCYSRRILGFLVGPACIWRYTLGVVLSIFSGKLLTCYCTNPLCFFYVLTHSYPDHYSNRQLREWVRRLNSVFYDWDWNMNWKCHNVIISVRHSTMDACTLVILLLFDWSLSISVQAFVLPVYR